MHAGSYEARFFAVGWLRARDPSVGRVFMEAAMIRVKVLDPAQRVHLPVAFTRWGLALFRGS